MSDNYKTLRVPEDAWIEAKEQKESAGRTWGQQIVWPDVEEHTTTNADVVEILTDELRNQLDVLAFNGALTEEDIQRLESSLSTIEERTGKLERMVEGLQG